MAEQLLEVRKYPIGKFEPPESIEPDTLRKWIKTLEELPYLLQQFLQDVDESDLEKQYRPGGWSVRQVVHHLADSHINAYIRIKLALTEDVPHIKPYDENRWSELPDVDIVDVMVSVHILEGVHHRLVTLLKNLNTAELKRSFYHPESKLKISVAELVGLYAWHSEHHLAHIREALSQGI